MKVSIGMLRARAKPNRTPQLELTGHQAAQRGGHDDEEEDLDLPVRPARRGAAHSGGKPAE